MVVPANIPFQELKTGLGTATETPQTEPDSSSREDSTSVESEQPTAAIPSPESPSNDEASSLSAETEVEATSE